MRHTCNARVVKLVSMLLEVGSASYTFRLFLLVDLFSFKNVYNIFVVFAFIQFIIILSK